MNNQSNAPLSLICEDNPILSRKAIAVDQCEAVHPLVNQLITTALTHKGLGIAAPQVGHSLRLFILSSHPSERYPQAPLMEPTAIINPEIIAHNETQVRDWEGCLSVPGKRGLVPRYTEIEAKYQDRWGNWQHQCFTGFIARIFQHEYDHLNGILFPQRLLSPADLVSEEEFRTFVQPSQGATNFCQANRAAPNIPARFPSSATTTCSP